MTVSSEIEFHVNKATRLALAEIRRLARKILREHSNLDEFVMAMGLATFTVKGEVDSLGLEDRAYFRPLAKLIADWDNMLGLTGEPMRFTAHGPEVTEW